MSARAAAARRGEEALAAFEFHTGPLPTLDYLNGLNELSPGSADKIIDEFVAQGTHRRTQEDRVVGGSERRSGIGQALGFILLLIAMVFGVLIALMVNAPAGGSVIGAAIASGALVYVVGGRPPRPKD